MTSRPNIPTEVEPSPNTPERECWYINMGALGRDFFTVDAMVKAAH